MSREWYRYETGNEKRKDLLRSFLRRNGLRFEVKDESKTKRCDWWRVEILIIDPKQIQTINTWLNTH